MALLGRHRIVAAFLFQKEWSVMYLKRLLAFLCCFTLVFCLFPSSAFATGGNGNIDGGGGSMGHGTSSNFWNSGNDGVRITVVDASSGTAVSSPLDFSNRTQKTSLLHLGKSTNCNTWAAPASPSSPALPIPALDLRNLCPQSSAARGRATSKPSNGISVLNMRA